MLAAGPAGPKHVFADVLVADVDRDLFADLRGNVHGGEAGLPLAFGVERADADQAVDARLALEVSVGQRAADGDGGAVDARLFVVLAVQQRGLVIVVLGPGQIHPQQHFRPIVGVGAAVAGIDRQQGGVGIQRAAEQGLEFRLLKQFLQPLGGGGHLGRQVLVLVGHLDQRRQVVAQLDEFLQRPGDRLRLFSSPTTSWARSRLFQNSAAAICCSIWPA